MHHLLKRIRFIGEDEMVNLLVTANRELLRKLASKGVKRDNIIYVQIDEAGSSSGVTLNLLRDSGRLQNSGVRFFDSRDTRGLRAATLETGTGAIIYVDDFIGSGLQFQENHLMMRENIRGNFSEFLLAVCVCEEADQLLSYESVELVPCLTHFKRERPLLDECTALKARDRETLRALCRRLDPIDNTGLGFNRMATMVVPYRNTPDNCSLALRGAVGQSPIFGLLPRTTDFSYVPRAGEI
jgi:hypothetical protein